MFSYLNNNIFTLMLSVIMQLPSILKGGELFSKFNISHFESESELLNSHSSVQFIFFTRKRLHPFELQINNMSNFIESGFNISNPTKIIIHGFQSGINEDVFVVNKNAYLEQHDYNVIGMDWSVLCSFEYITAINGVKVAGTILVHFLNWLTYNGVNLKNVHLIGHSLGAHVAGIAGNQIKKGKVGRITGLDPAAPGFKELDSRFKIDINDAELVDVIHTYMDVLSFSQPMGHIDFYPNGGKWQPGCPGFQDIRKVPQSLFCNHARAYYLFAESIRNNKAFKCKFCTSFEEAVNGSCYKETSVYMGQAETYIPGLYFLKTNDKPPYSI